MEEYNREKTVIELSAANTQQGLPDFYAQLELPADDLTIYDTLQKPGQPHEKEEEICYN